jgi:D-glycero-alpha-D-manno-heptose-7-phosphate kinase
MIITRTPFRVSFFGGGTDYHTWYQEHGGAILSTSINHYCNIICSYKPPFFENKHRFVYRQIEEVNEIDEIQHPVIRKAMRYVGIDRGVEIHHRGELPARSGIGSSSSFTVGLLNALHALQGHQSSKKNLACEAIHIERNLVKDNVGVQDQIAASYGGLNKITINTDGTFNVDPVLMSHQRSKLLNDHLLLFFTNFSRTASTVAGDKIRNIPKKATQLHAMQSMVDAAVDILTSDGNILDFGRLLHETWLYKKQLSSAVSTGIIDDIYETARKAGAVGGKILGAGGGGFILFFAAPQDHPKIFEALSDLLWVPFEFEKLGAHVAYYSPTRFSNTAFMRNTFLHLKGNRNVENLKIFNDEERSSSSKRIDKIIPLQHEFTV